MGHYLFARLFKVKIYEFSVGMGPDIISFQKGDTKYSLKLFPIGGACMFEGEDGLQVKEGEISEGSFLHANVWSRISTVVAGPLFNFILGFIVAIIMILMGVVIREPMATDVAEAGAAMEAGLLPGDRIVSLDGEKIYLFDEILLFTMTHDGGEVEVVYERDGREYTTLMTPKYDQNEGRYLLGIVNGDYVEAKGIDTIKYAWYEVRYCVKNTYKSLGMLIQGRVGRQDVAGPVGIAVNVVGKTYDVAKDYGWQSVVVSMLNITMLLSVNLGILNLLPIPALDGGRLVFMLIEVVRGKPVPPEKEGMVHFIGLMFFMVLMVFIFFNDLANIFM
jgi:regulator of sigma E protease